MYEIIYFEERNAQQKKLEEEIFGNKEEIKQYTNEIIQDENFNPLNQEVLQAISMLIKDDIEEKIIIQKINKISWLKKKIISNFIASSYHKLIKSDNYDIEFILKYIKSKNMKLWYGYIIFEHIVENSMYIMSNNNKKILLYLKILKEANKRILENQSKEDSLDVTVITFINNIEHAIAFHYLKLIFKKKMHEWKEKQERNKITDKIRHLSVPKYEITLECIQKKSRYINNIINELKLQNKTRRMYHNTNKKKFHDMSKKEQLVVQSTVIAKIIFIQINKKKLDNLEEIIKFFNIKKEIIEKTEIDIYNNIVLN